jgi:hypothetical protein
MILRHLRTYGAITAIEALNEYGCFRLAARIRDLRLEGHLILSTPLTVNGKTVARYTMELAHEQLEAFG